MAGLSWARAGAGSVRAVSYDALRCMSLFALFVGASWPLVAFTLYVAPRLTS
jgi:hypothetical protein